MSTLTIGSGSGSSSSGTSSDLLLPGGPGAVPAIIQDQIDGKAAVDLANVTPATGRGALGLPTTQEVFTTSFDGVPGKCGYIQGVGNIAYRAAAFANQGVVNNFVRSANFTGGTTGFVNTVLGANSAVTNCGSNFEWTFLSSMSNSSTGSSENSAACFQARAELANSSPTFAGTSELIDLATVANAGYGRVTHEFDYRGNGGDPTSSKVVIDIVGSQYVRTGGALALVVGQGLNIGRPDTSEGDVTFTRGVSLRGKFGAAIFTQTTVADQVLRMTGAATKGIFMPECTFTDAAITLGRGQALALEDTGVVTGTMSASGSGTTIYRLKVGSVEYFGFDFDNGFFRIGGVQVLGARQTGWSACTGYTAIKGGLNLSTATTAQKDALLLALVNAAITHGLLGT